MLMQLRAFRHHSCRPQTRYSFQGQGEEIRPQLAAHRLLIRPHT
ncbi:Uncharacterised protein [Vibrio cholerae]|nr:Uncharacterised protein [Vibrio cholerae]